LRERAFREYDSGKRKEEEERKGKERGGKERYLLSKTLKQSVDEDLRYDTIFPYDAFTFILDLTFTLFFSSLLPNLVYLPP